MGNVQDLTDSEFESVIRVNGLHVMYGMKVFLQILAKREQRSGLVITSSGLSNFSYPGMAIYGATKAFVRNLGEGVHYEVRDKIDVLSWQAAGVRTKITASGAPKDEMEKMHANPLYIDPDVAVECAFRDLGHTPGTEGSYKHLLTRKLAQTFLYLWCCGGLCSRRATEKRKKI